TKPFEHMFADEGRVTPEMEAEAQRKMPHLYEEPGVAAEAVEAPRPARSPMAEMPAAEVAKPFDGMFPEGENYSNEFQRQLADRSRNAMREGNPEMYKRVYGGDPQVSTLESTQAPTCSAAAGSGAEAEEVTQIMSRGGADVPKTLPSPDVQPPP